MDTVEKLTIYVDKNDLINSKILSLKILIITLTLELYMQKQDFSQFNDQNFLILSRKNVKY